MRIFTVQGHQIRQRDALPPAVPDQGFVWVALHRSEVEARLGELQAGLQRLCGATLVDLHVSDLLNPHLPSHFDYTGQYDVLVFRRLAQGAGAISGKGEEPEVPRRKGGPPVLRRLDTVPVGFAVFDNVLLSVHPEGCPVLESYASRLLTLSVGEADEPGRSAPVRMVPSGPADLMLRLVGQMVDGFLELRRELTRQLDHWQQELLSPRTRFSNWGSMLDARIALHQLDEICEDQRVAVQDWITALGDWPEAEHPSARREQELLKVRSRDVLEHIERVVHHVRRLEQSAETAVQIHFSAQSHRTNDIMRTLTVLTAVFLPLNLIAGIFGMNFEFIPLLHLQSGFWLAIIGMLVVAVALSGYFWRKRYLDNGR
ncbi:magnesium transporter CorA family protein [Hydrogenophaga aquatica]